MKVISCRIENFASYELLEFNFDDTGLILINGPTGSGKSTLCDVIPWALFGKTAKGGTVDEILSWPGDKVTYVNIIIEINGQRTLIKRTRGPKAKDNDLFYMSGFDMPHIRGKDINDTQKRVNELLGITADLYLSGAYFHEFNQTAQFFTTTAKNRRAICEQLVDLSLPKSLQEKLAIVVKADNAELATINNKLVPLETKLEIYEGQIRDETRSSALWAGVQNQRIIIEKKDKKHFLLQKAKDLDNIDSQILAIKTIPDSYYITEIDKLLADMPPETEPCTECGADKHNKERELVVHKLHFLEKEQLENSHKIQRLSGLLKAKEATNSVTWIDKDLSNETNPHEKNKKELQDKLGGVKDLLAFYQSNKFVLEQALADSEQLVEVIQAFRGELVQNTIADLEAKTNLLLSNHFDAEIKVSLMIEDADKLEVIITKDGNTCSYTQLSKGQRQLLKLSFGVSVMKCVSNHHGVNFNQVFFDETLDGMDDTTKTKAIRMLETLALEYDSIYLVEHSETVKALIDNKYSVELVNGQSKIEKS